jgi:GT2 family glycosyltransferase
MNKTITVVIPNYNGSKLLANNLPSVISAVESYGHESTIVVVDDGSTDDSIHILDTIFPFIKVVKHQQNKGFAEAVHSGVKEANTELVFILNSDVLLNDTFFVHLISYFDDPKTFSVNPLIYDEQGEVKRHSWNFRQFRRGRIALLNWTLDEALKIVGKGQRCPTIYGHGGSMLLRKSMFDMLNGFDSIFKPYYGEDSDLGIRAWRQGWYSYFEPRSSLVHQSIGSIRASVKMKRVKCIRRRNRYLLEWIHLTPKQLMLSTLPFSLMQLIGELLTFDFVNIKGFCLALLKIPEVFASRSKIRESEKLTINQVFQLIKQKEV